MTRSAAEIEREIDTERSALGATLHDMRDRLSLESALHRAADALRDNGQEIADAVGRQVRANPLGVALTGAGLAWLILGPRTQATTRGNGADGHDRSFGAGTFPHDGDSDQRRHAEASRGGPDRDGAGPGLAERARDAITETARRAGTRAEELRSRVSSGLEDFSDEARRRVMDARHAAADAVERGERMAIRGGRAGVALFSDHPIATGALALAAGAAVAALLPRSDSEERLFGTEADRLMARARRVYEEEKQLLRRTGASMAETAREAGREMADTASAALNEAADQAGEAMRQGADVAADATDDVAADAPEEAVEDAIQRQGGPGRDAEPQE